MHNSLWSNHGRVIKKRLENLKDELTSPEVCQKANNLYKKLFDTELLLIELKEKPEELDDKIRLLFSEKNNEEFIRMTDEFISFLERLQPKQRRLSKSSDNVPTFSIPQPHSGNASRGHSPEFPRLKSLKKG